MWEVPAFSSYASICGDIFISWDHRFSPYGDTVNLSRCFYSSAILTLCVNPQLSVKGKKEDDLATSKDLAMRPPGHMQQPFGRDARLYANLGYIHQKASASPELCLRQLKFN